MSSSGGDGNDEEVSNKKMKAKRGRKASVKDKPPAPDNGLSSKSKYMWRKHHENGEP